MLYLLSAFLLQPLAQAGEDPLSRSGGFCSGVTLDHTSVWLTYAGDSEILAVTSGCASGAEIHCPSWVYGSVPSRYLSAGSSVRIAAPVAGLTGPRTGVCTLETHQGSTAIRVAIRPGS